MSNHKDFAITIAKKAAEIMRANFGLGMKKEWKADNSPVTESDLKINRMVVEEVAKNFPTHAVLGEEESNYIEGAEYVWVCDPVDGTLPFSHGMPTFTFSLALVKNGVSILGVIYDAMLDRMFFAELGKGAFLNNIKISVNKMDLGKGSLAAWDAKTLSNLKALYPDNRLITLHSICYEGVLVASGQMAATYFDHPFAHDIAAIKVIVEEAGGKVTDRDGNEQRYDTKINGALISNGIVHDELLKFIKTI